MSRVILESGIAVVLYIKLDGKFFYKESPILMDDFAVGRRCVVGNGMTHYWSTSPVQKILNDKEVSGFREIIFKTMNNVYKLELREFT